MNIINLTDERYKYCLEQESILKMDRALISSDNALRIMHHPLIYMITERVNTFLHHAHSFAYQYANQVPVFLVTKDMIGKNFNIDFLGHHLPFTVPNDNLPTKAFDDDVKTILDRDQEVKRETVDPTEEECDKKGKQDDKYEPKDEVFEPSPIIDLWGIYIGSYLKIHSFRNAHPRIFIWVDKIHDYVQNNHDGDKYYYNLLTCQVILHEMMHALMDVNILPFHHRDTKSIPEWFRVLREESLAEAGSLTLMDGVWSKNDIAFLNNHVSAPGRPFQYRLGSCYFKAGNGVVSRAIKNWLEREYNQKLAEDWLKYVKSHFPKTDDKQLKLYDDGFDFPYVFKYKSLSHPHEILYSKKELVIQVIQDYAKSHHTSKSDLMAIFPDSLNNYYEVFIDPQIDDHFTGKDNPSNTCPIYDDHEVKCTDGDLIICDYWHPDSMHPFVDLARQLGYEIIDFWT